MRTVLALAALLLLAGCGAEGRAIDTDNPGDETSTPARPTEVPAADGEVRTRQLATVMDTGRPELCLGPVAESYPPQCGGPPITGWRWADHEGTFDQQGDVRWGEYVVTGTFDGQGFTATGAVPAASYDAPSEAPSPGSAPSRELSDTELAGIAEEVGALPGAQGAYASEGQVTVDVLYDDGSMQQWADATYGRDVVVVVSALVPTG